MASVLVNGVRLPVLVAGHPALEICNTRAGWGSPAPKEYLVDEAALREWVVHSGVTASPGPPGSVLRRVLAFRDAYYAVLTQHATAADWALVDRECRAALGSARLAAADTGPLARWVAEAPDPLTAIARAAADLLLLPDSRKVRACPGQGCGWVFLDPRGRRRWCSMAWCGNRAKAARHAGRAR